MIRIRFGKMSKFPGGDTTSKMTLDIVRIIISIVLFIIIKL